MTPETQRTLLPDLAALLLLAGPALILALAELIDASPLEGFAPVVTAMALLALFTRGWRSGGLTHPVVLFVPFWFLRYLFPFALVAISGRLPDLYLNLGLSQTDLYRGLLIACVAGLGACIPSAFVLNSVRRRPRVLSQSPRLKDSILAGWLLVLIGAASWFYFVKVNVHVNDRLILEVFEAGAFRGLEIQEGTGWAWYLSLLMISGSALVAEAHLAQRRSLTLVMAVPTVVAFLFFLLGGRARAFTPIAVTLVLLAAWRRNQAAVACRTSGCIKNEVPFAVVLLTVAVLVLLAGALYRGGALASLGETDLSVEYLRYGLEVDLGQIHGPAAAAKFSEGELGATTVVAALSWPVSELVGLSGRSPGVFVVEGLVGFSGRRWGIHSGLGGAAYLTLGVWGVVIAGLVWGLMVRKVHRSWVDGSARPWLFAIVTWYLIRVFFEGLEKWGELFWAAGIAWLFSFFVERLHVHSHHGGL